MVWNISNIISLLRAPFAFLFLIDNSTLRLLLVILAMISDGIDGYWARKSKTTSSFGAILDPAMDKFFVFFVLGVFFFEGKINLLQISAMLSRDFFLCVFGLYLRIRNRWEKFKFRAIRWGKITTALQFLILSGLCVGNTYPWPIFTVFVLIGLFAFYELLQLKNEPVKAS